MSDLSGARVAVVGAGVFGLAVAAEASARGAACTVIDPAAPGDNASGVSAGMLAPAFESALDPLDHGRFPLLAAARDLWPPFAEVLDRVELEREGAVWVGEEAAVEAVQAALGREGSGAQHLDHRAVAAGLPGLRPGLLGVFTPADWRIDAAAALGALERLLERRGVRRLFARADEVSARAVRADGRAIEADAVVVAAGYGSRRFASTAPELACLTPIKGERLLFPGAEPREGLTVRSAAGYVVPTRGGPICGATMEAGVDDRTLTAAAAARLREAAAALFPHLSAAPAAAAAGVRAATPDGLPLVGRAVGGVILAAGARRNGWLLAPLVAQVVAATIAGADPGPWAAVLRPNRTAP